MPDHLERLNKILFDDISKGLWINNIKLTLVLPQSVCHSGKGHFMLHFFKKSVLQEWPAFCVH